MRAEILNDVVGVCDLGEDYTDEAYERLYNGIAANLDVLLQRLEQTETALEELYVLLREGESDNALHALDAVLIKLGTNPESLLKSGSSAFAQPVQDLVAKLRDRYSVREIVTKHSDGTEIVYCGDGPNGYIGWVERSFAEFKGYEIQKTDGDPDVLALAARVAAGEAAEEALRDAQELFEAIAATPDIARAVRIKAEDGACEIAVVLAPREGDPT